jgi:endonuclease/exonuclease/phosphatase family metal-dependent hydrolase
MAAVVLAAVWASLAAIACTRSPAGTPLRVMSYNIQAGGGDLSRIADVIRSEAPDVVALQEVDVHWSARSGFADQANELAGALGMEARFGAIYRLPSDSAATPPRQYGLAFLTRRPIRGFRNHSIPRLSTVEPETDPLPRPGFLELIIDVQGADVRVFNTHLDYRADPRVRRMQVSAMLDIIGEHATPTILTGDLNAPPDADELQPLFTRFRDAWTAVDDAGPTYPAHAPLRRIDYVLVSDEFRVRDARVIPSVASDHRPVVADLQLARTR